MDRTSYLGVMGSTGSHSEKIENRTLKKCHNFCRSNRENSSIGPPTNEVVHKGGVRLTTVEIIECNCPRMS